MDYGYLVHWILEILSVLGAVLFVVFFFGMCIIVHELGHFMVAKWRGLHIDAFSIGFKKVWCKKVNGIEYRIGCLPLGGYVELPQIDSSSEIPKSADGKELPRAKPLDRLLTAAAGPLCNILFGFLLGCIVWWIGIPQDTPKMRAVEVAHVEEKSPEYAAGLRVGDKIVKINGKTFFMTWKDVVAEILTTIGEVKLEVERNGELQTIAYLPAVNPNKMAVEKTAYPFFTPRIPIEFYPDKNSPAAKAGIVDGDQLLSINGNDCEDFGSVQGFINYYGDRPLEFRMRRAESREEYTVTILPETIPDELGYMTVYYSGVMLTPELTVIGLMPDFPAVQAGIQPGDRITACNGKAMKGFEEFSETVQEANGKALNLTVDRNGTELTLTLIPKAVSPRTIGVSFMLRDHPTPWQQFTGLIELTAKSLRSMAVRLGNRLGFTDQQSNISARNMSGPVGMAVVLYRSVRLSPTLGIYFVVMISFALAIFNLLPLPVLDGGHVFMSIIEMVFRKPLPIGFVRVLSYVFVALLVTLMVYVTFIDVLRVMPEKMREKVEGSSQPVETEAVAPAAPESGK